MKYRVFTSALFEPNKINYVIVTCNFNNMNSDMILYYKERAKEYEKVYEKPERYADLSRAEQILGEIFRKKHVFEIACGTGYWTKRIATTAKSIFATDVNDSVIELAKLKTYAPAKVRFQVADMYQLDNSTRYENLFAGFIWSHIKLQELSRFIDTVNALVKTGGKVVFMDNKYVEGSSQPMTSMDEYGNNYQVRKLENGTLHNVVKNFPTKKFMLQLLKGKVRNLSFTCLQYYWILEYEIISENDSRQN